MCYQYREVKILNDLNDRIEYFFLKTYSKRVMHCNLLFIMYLYQYAKVTINLFMYKYNLHPLVPKMSSCIAFSPLFTSFYPSFTPSNLSKIRQVRDRFMSEEGHFSPLGEGVKYLPNPHILHLIF